MGQSRDYSVRDSRNAAFPSLPQQHRRHPGQELQVDIRPLLPVQVKLYYRRSNAMKTREINSRRSINRPRDPSRCRRKPHASMSATASEVPSDPAAKRNRWQVSDETPRPESPVCILTKGKQTPSTAQIRRRTLEITVGTHPRRIPEQGSSC